MSERMTSRLTCDALRMAPFRRHRPHGVIVHSDRGSQYCALEYRELLERNGLICSMSARGDCYDRVESWNHSLKVEAVHGEHLAGWRRVPYSVLVSSGPGRSEGGKINGIPNQK
jgi:putative transposase